MFHVLHTSVYFECKSDQKLLDILFFSKIFKIGDIYNKVVIELSGVQFWSERSLYHYKSVRRIPIMVTLKSCCDTYLYSASKLHTNEIIAQFCHYLISTPLVIKNDYL